MKQLYLVDNAWLKDDPEYGAEDSIRPATNADITIERLTEMMDQWAENHNAHGFVRMHPALASLLEPIIGHDKTLAVLLALVDRQGLPGLTGVCGMGEGK